jgi:hypothetical protein
VSAARARLRPAGAIDCAASPRRHPMIPRCCTILPGALTSPSPLLPFAKTRFPPCPLAGPLSGPTRAGRPRGAPAGAACLCRSPAFAYAPRLLAYARSPALGGAAICTQLARRVATPGRRAGSAAPRPRRPHPSALVRALAGALCRPPRGRPRRPPRRARRGPFLAPPAPRPAAPFARAPIAPAAAAPARCAASSVSCPPRFAAPWAGLADEKKKQKKQKRRRRKAQETFEAPGPPRQGPALAPGPAAPCLATPRAGAGLRRTPHRTLPTPHARRRADPTARPTL